MLFSPHGSHIVEHVLQQEGPILDFGWYSSPDVLFITHSKKQLTLGGLVGYWFEQLVLWENSLTCSPSMEKFL